MFNQISAFVIFSIAISSIKCQECPVTPVQKDFDPSKVTFLED
jgi:hypothetical protein